VEEVKKLTGGEGSSIVIDTTGVPALIEAGLEVTASRGKLIFIGVPPSDYSLSVHVITAIKVGCFQFQYVPLAEAGGDPISVRTELLTSIIHRRGDS
jgi:threonine dehydrogenase-like Zn-dependent dehydrogenase